MIFTHIVHGITHTHKALEERCLPSCPNPLLLPFLFSLFGLYYSNTMATPPIAESNPAQKRTNIEDQQQLEMTKRIPAVRFITS
jgi:hypothetical protein